MYPILSNSTSSHGGTIKVHDFDCLIPTAKIKKKRNLPGNPDPDAEVVALSPKSLMTTNRFVCEVCNKGFQRDQNLQLHRRGHNLPWKLKQRNSNETVKKRAYVCPEPSCVHHHPSRALGDLTGIKKHFCRKHGEKKWKCDKCSKIYAVQSDWKAHNKTCGTREYRCDCGTLFSRKDSFVTHRAFCDALAEESARQLSAASNNNNHVQVKTEPHHHNILFSPPPPLQNSTTTSMITTSSRGGFQTNQCLQSASCSLSATALLQKAAIIGATSSSSSSPSFDMMGGFGSVGLMTWQNKNNDRHSLTRDFLGLKNGSADVVRDHHVLTYAGVTIGYDVDACHERGNHSLVTARGFGFAEPPAASEAWGLDC